MLINRLFRNEKGIIPPNEKYKYNPNFPKFAVGFFSKKIMAKFLEHFNPEIIETLSTTASDYPVYKIKLGEKEIAVFMPPVGAPACAMIAEYLIALGVNQLLMVGCAGNLVKNLNSYSLMVVGTALRGEGTSYYYLPEADKIELNTDFAEKLNNTLKELGAECFIGTTWTTDSKLRETPTAVQIVTEMGAQMVEMECSAVAAVCEHRGITYGEILYGSDSLAGKEYNSCIKEMQNLDQHNKILFLVLDCVNKL